MVAAERRGWLALGSSSPFVTVHGPAPAPGPSAVVVVPPFGWDDMCSYRARRELAVRLAARGTTVVRLDLPGAGDSAGSPWDPDRLDAWVEAVAGAAALARAGAGVERVVAVGFGLGGLLAHLAVGRGAAIDDLALWGTPARGRAVVRELQAFAQLEDAALPDPDPPQGAVVAAGYALSEETAQALRGVDLARDPLPGGARRRMLLLDRDGIAPDARLADAAREAGVTVTTASGRGWGRMLEEPQYSRIPEQALGHLLAFAQAPAPASPLAAPAAPELLEELHLDGDVREHPTELAGPRGPIPAIVTEPDGGATGPELSVVWLNAGPQRRIGPNRLWVTTARRWAARGVRVVRVDLGGIGDAPLALDLADVGSLYTGEHLAEVHAVLAALRAGGPQRFVLGGLCSGASWAVNAAATEDDVAGVLLINPPALTFDRGRHELRDARHLIHQLTSAASWRKVARGRVNWRRPFRLARAVARQLAATTLRRRAPVARAALEATAQDERLLLTLPGRGDRVALVFSGQEAFATALHESQGLARLAASPRVGVHRVGALELPTHTLRPLVLQRDVERILDDELGLLLAQVEPAAPA